MAPPSSLSSPPLVPTGRAPPSADLDWAPSHFPINTTRLPPLPSIRSPSLAVQARTTKDYVGMKAGRLSNYNYDDEVGSYRRLEWMGDSKLHDLYAKRLFRRLPEVGSGVLSSLRESLSSNNTHSYISWAYGLDRTLLEPPSPKKPSKRWRPLSQAQSIVADLFEAHIGALVEEDREPEVDAWAAAFFAGVSEELEEQAERLVQETRAKEAVSRSEMKKRVREENTFEGGCEVDPATKRARTSYLADCPSRPDPSPCLRFNDRIDSDGAWHTHLVLGDGTVGCGRGKKQHHAHDAAMNNYFTLAASNLDLQRFTATPHAPRSPPGPPVSSSRPYSSAFVKKRRISSPPPSLHISSA
ncbi:hypothetical protein JCM6882_009557 [Rhodosporidiobolus microsporus]